MVDDWTGCAGWSLLDTVIHLAHWVYETSHLSLRVLQNARASACSPPHIFWLRGHLSRKLGLRDMSHLSEYWYDYRTQWGCAQVALSKYSGCLVIYPENWVYETSLLSLRVHVLQNAIRLCASRPLQVFWLRGHLSRKLGLRDMSHLSEYYRALRLCASSPAQVFWLRGHLVWNKRLLRKKTCWTRTKNVLLLCPPRQYILWTTCQMAFHNKTRLFSTQEKHSLWMIWLRESKLLDKTPLKIYK
jgi:hypothetical protein